MLIQIQLNGRWLPDFLKYVIDKMLIHCLSDMYFSIFHLPFVQRPHSWVRALDCHVCNISHYYTVVKTFSCRAVSRNEVANGIHIKACCQLIHFSLVAACLVTFITYNLMYSVHFNMAVHP